MDVTVLSDASFCCNHKIAGYGYWIASARGKTGGEGVVAEEVFDPNTAEMMAICNAIWHGVGAGLIRQGDNLLIQTDSVAAIDRFKGEKVNITEQQSRVIAYFDKVTRRLNLGVRFRHVKAHTSCEDKRSIANRMCDKRAKTAMRKARNAKIADPHIQQIKEILREQCQP